MQLKSIKLIFVKVRCFPGGRPRAWWRLIGDTLTNHWAPAVGLVGRAHIIDTLRFRMSQNSKNHRKKMMRLILLVAIVGLAFADPTVHFKEEFGGKKDLLYCQNTCLKVFSLLYTGIFSWQLVAWEVSLNMLFILVSKVYILFSNDIQTFIVFLMIGIGSVESSFSFAKIMYINM